jgi:hypothetical protein
LALQFALDLPGPETTLVGMASTDLVAVNCAAAARKVDGAMLEHIAGIFAGVSGVTWPSGSSEWSDDVHPSEFEASGA